MACKKGGKKPQVKKSAGKVKTMPLSGSSKKGRK